MAGYGNLFSMEEYYRDYIRPLGYKYRKRKSGKIVCPFHDDQQPSMGFIKNPDGSEIFHCFGCGAKGDILTLHQRIEREWHNRNISRKQALRELCNHFGYSYEEIEQNAEQEKKEVQKKALTFYIPDDSLTERKFIDAFTKAKRQKRDIRYFNSLIIQMIMMHNKERSEIESGDKS